MTYTLKMDLVPNELMELVSTLETMEGYGYKAMRKDVRWALNSPGDGPITVKFDWTDESVAALSYALLQRADEAAATAKTIEGRNAEDFKRRGDWQDARDEEMDSWGLLAQIAAYRRAAAEALLIQAAD
jgi:hypothetical protein